MFLLFLLADLSTAKIGSDFVDIGAIAHIKVELRYASTNNFMGVDLYGEFRKAFLHKEAATKIKKAADHLQKIKPGWSLLIFDALRPRSVQKRLFAKVKGTKQEQYVADPAKGSIHNFGMAVDLSLQDQNGREVDMGTPFDSFEELAQPVLEEKFLKEGKLKPHHIENRKILRTIMTEAGFIQLPHEWWHYDALPGNIVREKYQIVE